MVMDAPVNQDLQHTSPRLNTSLTCDIIKFLLIVFT